MLDAFQKIIAQEGVVGGLFKGISPALLRQCTYGSARLALYPEIKKVRLATLFSLGLDVAPCVFCGDVSVLSRRCVVCFSLWQLFGHVDGKEFPVYMKVAAGISCGTAFNHFLTSERIIAQVDSRLSRVTSTSFGNSKLTVRWHSVVCVHPCGCGQGQNAGGCGWHTIQRQSNAV